MDVNGLYLYSFKSPSAALLYRQEKKGQNPVQNMKSDWQRKPWPPFSHHFISTKMKYLYFLRIVILALRWRVNKQTSKRVQKTVLYKENVNCRSNVQELFYGSAILNVTPP
jgi:hypothetical protein